MNLRLHFVLAAKIAYVAQPTGHVHSTFGAPCTKALHRAINIGGTAPTQRVGILKESQIDT